MMPTDVCRLGKAILGSGEGRDESSAVLPQAQPAPVQSLALVGKVREEEEEDAGPSCSSRALTPALQTPLLTISNSNQELFLRPQPTQHPGTSSKPIKLEEVPLPIQSFLLL